MIIRKFLICIAWFLLPINAFADSDVINPAKQEHLIISENDKSATYSVQNEMKRLFSRIEVLEHTVLRLQTEVEQLKSTGLGDNKYSNNSKSNLANTAADIFDVSPAYSNQVEGGEDAPPIEKIATPAQINNVAEDKKAYDLALAALKDNKLKQAEEQFAEFLKKYPKSSLQSNVYFWYGETFFRRSLFDAAAINYLKGYKQFPKGVKASDSLLKLALCLGELKKKKEACNMLSRLESEFPSRSSASMKRAADAKISFGCK